MAIDAAIDVVSLDDDIVVVRTAVSPPLGRAKEADDRCPRRNSDVCWAGVAADVNFGTF